MTSLGIVRNRNASPKHRPALRLIIVVAITLGTTLRQADSHAAALRTVALTGQHAPDTDSGVNFDTIDAHLSGYSVFVCRGPVLNDVGQVAFRANLTGSGVGATNKVGVWSEGSGNLGLVARAGNPAPGGGNFGTVVNVELFSPNLNDAGQTAFYGALTNGNMGIWSEGSGNLALVAREGTPAPGAPAGVSFSFAPFLPTYAPDLAIPPVLNNVGQISLSGFVKGSGTNNTNNTGIWSGGAGSLGLVVRAGGQAFGTPSGINYDFGPTTYALNDAGQNAFISWLTGSGVNDTNYGGYWSGASGSLSLVMRFGDPAPGTPAGVNFGAQSISHGFNNAGKIAFEGFLIGNVDSTNDEGLWSNASGSVELVAREGSHAAGAPAGVNYGEFRLSGGWPVLNDAGQIAFVASIDGAGVDESNNEGIWSGATDNLLLVARRGDQAPDALSGVRFSELDYPALNSSGQVAFRAELTGSGVGSTNDRGIWATDDTGALQLIARAGDQLEVAPGDFRTLKDLNFSSASGNSDGRSSGFNNLGQLVFWAKFTDLSQGVFVSNAVAHLPGDFNNDGTVDAADYVYWRKNDGTKVGYDAWRAHFGTSLGVGSGSALPSAQPLSAAVPEPTCIAVAAAGVIVLSLRRRRRVRTL